MKTSIQTREGWKTYNSHRPQQFYNPTAYRLLTLAVLAVVSALVCPPGSPWSVDPREGRLVLGKIIPCLFSSLTHPQWALESMPFCWGLQISQPISFSTFWVAQELLLKSKQSKAFSSCTYGFFGNKIPSNRLIDGEQDDSQGVGGVKGWRD